jgi:uncharacterized protein with HEPN domain
LFQIGESFRQITLIDKSINKRFPKLNIDNLYNIRNYIGHACVDIDSRTLWNALVSTLPQLLEAFYEFRDEYLSREPGQKKTES